MGIELKNMDCLDLLKSLPDASVDLMLTDPPYGVTDMEWDKPINLAELWLEWERVVKPNGAFVIFSTHPFTTDLIISRRGFFKYEWIWEKSLATNFPNANKMPLKKHENILVFYRQQPTYNPQPTERSEINKLRFRGGKTVVRKSKVKTEVYSIERKDGDSVYPEFGYPNSILAFKSVFGRNGQRFHPSQKPIDLIRYFVRTYTNLGETVFDGYSGSGTTAEACILEGRKFIGSELNKEYYDKSIERISIALSKPELFT